MTTGSKYFFSGGQDGSIKIRKLENLHDCVSIQAHGWKNFNFSIGSASQQIEGLYYSCGKDGIVTIWKVGNIQIKLSDAVNKGNINFKKIVSQKEKLVFYEEAIENEYFEKMKDEINKKKKVQLEKIGKIKIQLKELLEENESHEQLEKL